MELLVVLYHSVTTLIQLPTWQDIPASQKETHNNQKQAFDKANCTTEEL
jgi:hypothetical protein